MGQTIPPLAIRLKSNVSPVLPEQRFLPDAYRLPAGSLRGGRKERGRNTGKEDVPGSHPRLPDERIGSACEAVQRRDGTR